MNLHLWVHQLLGATAIFKVATALPCKATGIKFSCRSLCFTWVQKEHWKKTKHENTKSC